MIKPVWIVDNIPAVAESITALLITEHIDCIAIYSGEGVNKRLDDGEVPSCIITDISMGPCDGNTVIERVKDNPQYAFPIIVITGDIENISRSVIGRVSRVLNKPVDPRLIVDEVRRLLGQTRQ